MRRLHRRSVIDQAKKAVPLPMVLGLAGFPIDALPERGVAIKAWCPWTDMHPGEREKEMRVYAGNDCYCFVCNLSMDPVSIAARLWSVSNPQAAQRLLAMVADSATANSQDPDDEGTEGFVLTGGGSSRRRAGAVAALGRWADAHGVDRFSEDYGKCLDIADRIATDNHVVVWLSQCKKFLLRDR